MTRQILPDLYRALSAGDHELAIGTRYAGNGSTGEWDESRLKISRFATALASPIMKTRLSDPMSGFFAVRRDVLLEAAPTPEHGRLQDPARPGRLASSARSRSPRSATPSAPASMASPSSMRWSRSNISNCCSTRPIGRFVPVKLVQFGAIGMLGVGVHLALLYLALNVVGSRLLDWPQALRGHRRDDLQLRAQQPASPTATGS